MIKMIKKLGVLLICLGVFSGTQPSFAGPPNLEDPTSETDQLRPSGFSKQAPVRR